ncbi:hypothetical protein XENTR_v10017323 [Xenopus tropicalis]|nr:hypothetical protein XENTR_v10017323 [Xenopus tropicalis]
MKVKPPVKDPAKTGASSKEQAQKKDFEAGKKAIEVSSAKKAQPVKGPAKTQKRPLQRSSQPRRIVKTGIGAKKKVVPIRGPAKTGKGGTAKIAKKAPPVKRPTQTGKTSKGQSQKDSPKDQSKVSSRFLV